MESGRQNLPWASEIHSLSLRHLARIIKKEHLEKVYTETKKQFLKNGQSTDAKGLDYRRTQDVQTKWFFDPHMFKGHIFQWGGGVCS